MPDGVGSVAGARSGFVRSNCFLRGRRRGRHPAPRAVSRYSLIEAPPIRLVGLLPIQPRAYSSSCDGATRSRLERLEVLRRGLDEFFVLGECLEQPAAFSSSVRRAAPGPELFSYHAARPGTPRCPGRASATAFSASSWGMPILRAIAARLRPAAAACAPSARSVPRAVSRGRRSRRSGPCRPSRCSARRDCTLTGDAVGVATRPCSP